MCFMLISSVLFKICTLIYPFAAATCRGVAPVFSSAISASRDLVMYHLLESSVSNLSSSERAFSQSIPRNQKSFLRPFIIKILRLDFLSKRQFDAWFFLLADDYDVLGLQIEEIWGPVGQSRSRRKIKVRSGDSTEWLTNYLKNIHKFNLFY